MDTSDSTIEFDATGRCNHCRSYEAAFKVLPPIDARREELDRIVEKIRSEGRNRAYDCVIGMSGGVDSTYVAYLTKTLGLRPLAVHLDNGWDSELAVSNIERTLKTLGIDLHTEVLDWEEFRELQLSFLKASVPDAEIPTDHAIVASLYRAARRLGVRFIVFGNNLRTEMILPGSWTYGALDWWYIRAVHRRWSRIPLRTYPHLSQLRRLYYRKVRKIEVISILDVIDYRKFEALKILEEKLGWRRYEGKHHESIYTRFFQSYILPRKFGIDKRKAHLSCLICAGEMTRESALEELKMEISPPESVRSDKEYVVKKLDVSLEEFDRLMSLPLRTHLDYPSSGRWLARAARVVRWGRKAGLLPPKRAGRPGFQG